MKVLVTGSSGRLGSAIVQRLVPSHQVLGVDLISGPATTIVGDATDPYLIKELVEQVEAVVHTVSLHVPDLVSHSPDEFRRVNVDATRGLLEAATTAKIRRLVYTSTTSIYGHSLVPIDRAVWVTEDLPPKPRDLYDETKLASEELFRSFAANEGLSAICLRVARYFPESPERLAAHRLYRGVDVRDAATAHMLALCAQQMTFGVFNISARSPFARIDLEELYRNAPAVIGRSSPMPSGYSASSTGGYRQASNASTWWSGPPRHSVIGRGTISRNSSKADLASLACPTCSGNRPSQSGTTSQRIEASC